MKNVSRFRLILIGVKQTFIENSSPGAVERGGLADAIEYGLPAIRTTAICAIKVRPIDGPRNRIWNRLRIRKYGV